MPTAWADAVGHAALAAVVALAWIGAGSPLLRRTSGDTLLDALNRLGLGALTFALATLAVAAAGGLRAWEPWLAVAVTAPVGAVRVRRDLRLPPPPRSRIAIALAAALAVTVALAVVATAAPVSSEDALFYHVGAPALYAHSGGLVELPWNWTAYQPFTVEMLTLDGLLLWSPVDGAFAALLLALAATAAVYGAGRSIATRRVGLLAAAIFLVQPFMLWESTSAFVEPGLALAVALAGWNALELLRRGSPSSAWLTGTFAWAAAGMKYTGLATGALVVAAVLVTERRRALLVPLLAPAVVVGLPWYLKNALETGDPLYPMLRGGANAEATKAMRDQLAGYGAGTSPLDALLLVPRLLAHGSLFDRGDFVSPLFLAFAPLALLEPRLRRGTAVVLAAGAVYGVFWFVGSQQARLLIPLMPPLAVLAAVGACSLARRGRLGRAVAVGGVAVAFCACLAISGVYAAQFAPVALGTQSRAAFLAHTVPYYDGIAWLDDHARPGERILTDVRTGLYLRPPYAVLTPDALPLSADRAEARRFLRTTPTLAGVLERDEARVVQLREAGAQAVARIPVRAVVSRTRQRFGPPETMLVFRLAD